MTSRAMTFSRFDYAAFSTFGTYAGCSLVIPIALVTLAADLNFPLDKGGMAAGGILHMGRSVAMCLSMAFCGFAAAGIGNRLSLGIAAAVMGGGIMLCAVAPVYGILLLALLLAGCGEGVIEGLGTPFVQDMHDSEPSRYVNFAHGFWSLGTMAVVIVSGLLLYFGFSWRIVVGLAGAMAIVPVLLLLLPQRRRIYPEKQLQLSRREVCANAARVCSRPRFWMFFMMMFMAGGGEFCLTFWAASFIQLNFGASALAGGIGTAIFAAGMFTGRTLSGLTVRQNQLFRLLVWTGIGATVVSALVPPLAIFAPIDVWWVLPVLYILLFFCGLTTAPFWPSIQSYAVDRMPELDSTMVFILLSCAGVPGCGFFTWLMGVCGDRMGLALAFFLTTLCFILMTLLLIWDRSRHVERTEVEI